MLAVVDHREDAVERALAAANDNCDVDRHRARLIENLADNAASEVRTEDRAMRPQQQPSDLRLFRERQDVGRGIGGPYRLRSDHVSARDGEIECRSERGRAGWHSLLSLAQSRTRAAW